MAYSEIEPFGPLYDDLRAGKIAAAVLNAGGVKRAKGGKRPWQAADVFGTLRPVAPAEQTPEQQVEAVRALSKAWGGRFTPGGADA